MPRKRFRPEEIIGKLCQADVLLGQGKKLAEVVKALGVSDITDSRWRQEFGGPSTAQAMRLKELERENGQLRKIVADLTLDTLIPHSLLALYSKLLRDECLTHIGTEGTARAGYGQGATNDRSCTA